MLSDGFLSFVLVDTSLGVGEKLDLPFTGELEGVARVHVVRRYDYLRVLSLVSSLSASMFQLLRLMLMALGRRW